MSYTQFIIQPTVPSSITMLGTVVTLFTFYLMFVGYMASYDIAYQPNFVMFMNFVFDNYDGQQSFERYVQSVCKKESFVAESDVNEGFSEKRNINFLEVDAIGRKFAFYLEPWKTWLSLVYHRLRLSFYTKGKTIKVKI